MGAAIIAGLISLLGLIIGKEQKVSEFRQAWIDELRTCLVAYLANINAIADALRVAAANGTHPSGLDQNYKLLNEANHGIRLRVNDDEEPSIALLDSMDQFEKLASKNSQLTPEKIREAEAYFLESSKNLLKFEWKRVKRGEKTYFMTKYVVITLIVLMLALFAYLWHNRTPSEAKDKTKSTIGASLTATLICSNAPLGQQDASQNQGGGTNGTSKVARPANAAATTLICDPVDDRPSAKSIHTTRRTDGRGDATFGR